jgi:hypothetical protein
MDKEEKRRIWKEKFEAWWANYLEENKIEKTEDNPNGEIKDNPQRRYVK